MSIALTIFLSGFALITGLAAGFWFAIWLGGKVLGRVLPDFLKKLDKV